MNKSQLVRSVMERVGVSQSVAAKAVDATFGVVTDSLGKGEDVSVPGFGSFSVSVRGARQVRNLHTGETMMSVAKCAPGFKFSKVVKDQVAKLPV